MFTTLITRYPSTQANYDDHINDLVLKGYILTQLSEQIEYGGH
jgi:hypothetical protein